MPDTLEGRLERIVYASQRDHYTVAKLKVAEDQDLITVVGQLATRTVTDLQFLPS